MKSSHGGISVLYVGTKSGTSLDRANAYRRLGHCVHHIDLREMLPRTVWSDRAIWKFGGDWVSRCFARRLRSGLGRGGYDLCHVDGGELVTPDLVACLRHQAPIIVNYNIDDPLGGRDGNRWNAYRRSVPFYDLCVVVRDINVTEVRALGARDAMRVFMAADEILHAPRTLTVEDRQYWQSDVSFIGAWFPERGPFLLELIERSVPLTIRGTRWDKAKEWSQLKPYWKGGAVFGDAYAKAIQCAKVNLGLLSKGNRDLHTTRSLEIPALGGLLCAERTSEHEAMYRDKVEAIFWSDAVDCASVCHAALGDPKGSAAIAAAGHEKVMRNQNYNESVIDSIVRRALKRDN